MMYQHNLAFAVKASGKVLREFGDKVYVPFGSEYSLLLKNLNTVRAVVNITIDGTNVVEGGLVLPPNMKEPFELERFVNDLRKGNRFKFIERTGKIENHRGIKMDDGLIRIEFEFEKKQPRVEVEEIHHHKKHIYHDEDYYWPPYRPYNPWYGGGDRVVRSFFNSSGSGLSGSMGSSDAPIVSNFCSTSAPIGASFSTTEATYDSAEVSAPTNETGITVKGSESNQSFQISQHFPMDGTKYSMIVHLLGETGQGKKVQEPVTVKTKRICNSCGTENKHNAKFCVECGTALEVLG